MKGPQGLERWYELFRDVKEELLHHHLSLLQISERDAFIWQMSLVLYDQHDQFLYDAYKTMELTEL